MKNVDLSILVPGKNEEFMGRTIEDLLENIRGNTEIIAILDGYLPDPPLTQNDPRVTIIHNPVSVGQRIAANQGARIAKGKYLMKVDAHCAFDKGFDTKMLEAFKETGDNVTMLPTMKNLHAFDWVCKKCGNRWYQSPTPIQCLLPDGETLNSKCNGTEFEKDVVWRAKPSPNSVSFRFDKTMHFQYWGEWGNKQKGDLIETMSIQGSCFMIIKKKWFELDICGEEFHSWGQQGVEVACKTWLSGGRVIVNRKTWYSHMFRTRGGDFGFPYSNPQSKVNENRELSRELFQRDKWPKAIHKFQWLLDKFNPPDWAETRGAIYYTHNELDEKIAEPVRERLKKVAKKKNINITCSSLKKMNFGDQQVRFPSMEKGYLAMFKQILGALEKSNDEIIFFTEHDVYYHESHFDFTPSDKKTFYYNQNVWFLRMPDGHALHYDVNQLSGMCGHRDALITHFRERYKMILEASEKMDDKEFNKFIRNMGFEPFTHSRIKWENQFKYETWKSKYPNVDIKHGANATGQRWKKEQYRNQHLLINWQETDDSIPGWGKTSNIVKTLQ